MQAGPLSKTAAERFRQKGYLAPLPALTPWEAADMRRSLEAYEAAAEGPISGSLRSKGHLVFTWVHGLVIHPHVLDAVESLLGPDLLCWNSSFFVKEPGDGRYVSWHQDATYWGLSEPDVVTAWIALSESNRANGCMRVIPGTHRHQVTHQDTWAANNMLSRGQEIAVEVDEAEAVDLVLEAGQMSLHHVLLAHGSGANPSKSRRIGLAVRYIAPRLRQVIGRKDSAMLVRGRDDHGHFIPETPPERDLSPDSLAHHAAMVALADDYLYEGAGKAR